MGGTPFEVPSRCPLAVRGHIRPAGRARRPGANNGLPRALPVRKASGAVPTPPPSPKCLHLHQSCGADPGGGVQGTGPKPPRPEAPRATAKLSTPSSPSAAQRLRQCPAECPRCAHLRGTTVDLHLPALPDLSEASAPPQRCSSFGTRPLAPWTVTNSHLGVRVPHDLHFWERAFRGQAG